MNGESNTLLWITAFGSIATPILITLVGAIGWKIRKKIERQYELENQLRADRIKTYAEILKPFIILFTKDEGWKSDSKNKSKDKDTVAIQKMISFDYRKKAFEMSLIGSDEVVIAYNNLMQFFYSRLSGGENYEASPSEYDIKSMLSYVGAFLLEIRKSMGNENTKLDNWQMLEWFLSDAKKYRES